MFGERDLAGTAKAFREGTHRVVAPETTSARMRCFMRAMGITRIANITGLDRIGIPVVAVVRPNARSVAVAQGKGISYAAAEASGLMEAIETYHAERIDLPLHFDSYAEMSRRHVVVDVAKLPMNRGSFFHKDFKLIWIEGTDLLSGKQTWVPYEMVHTDYRFPAPPGSGCFLASSNGLASGNHVLEAISHGISEVVERDSTALWHRLSASSQQKCRIDLGSVLDPGCRELLNKFDRADVDVAVWNTTTDLGIPAFLCWIVERDRGRRTLGRPTIGAGCHPARHIALSRALTEAAQERLTLISGSRDSLSRGDYYEEVGEAVIESQTRLFAERPTRPFSNGKAHEFETIEQDVAWQLERLREVGIDEVIAVDLTKPEVFDVPVVRVIIPGLEGYEDAPDYLPGKRAVDLALAYQ